MWIVRTEHKYKVEQKGKFQSSRYSIKNCTKWRDFLLPSSIFQWAWISIFMIPLMPNSYWLIRSRAGFKCCNQAKQQGSIFTKGASLITKMHLQTQPFQGQLDWPILLSCSELLPPEIPWAGYESFYVGPLSLFQLSWEFHLSSLLLKCDRAECGPQVFLSLYWGRVPRSAGYFLKNSIR